MQAARVPGRSQAGVSARRRARGSPVPKVSLYEGNVLYLAQRQTSALVLVTDAQLPYLNVGSGVDSGQSKLVLKTIKIRSCSSTH